MAVNSTKGPSMIDPKDLFGEGEANGPEHRGAWGCSIYLMIRAIG